MVESTPFQLSRIYASGWSEGRKCETDDSAEIDTMASRLNPHLSDRDRERWTQGFKDAALQQIGKPVKFRPRASRAGG